MKRKIKLRRIEERKWSPWPFDSTSPWRSTGFRGSSLNEQFEQRLRPPFRYVGIKRGYDQLALQVMRGWAEDIEGCKPIKRLAGCGKTM
jgi:hypothetical protein